MKPFPATVILMSSLSRPAIRNVAILAFCQAMLMSGNSLLVATSALVGAALAPNEAWATLPLALQFLATMLTTVPAAMLMRHIGRRHGFLVGCGIGMAGACLATWAIVLGEFSLFCLGAMLLGSFGGFAVYYRFAAAECVGDSHRARAISYVMAGAVIAAFLGPNLANWSREWVAGARFAGSYALLNALYIASLIALSGLKIAVTATGPHQVAARPLWLIARQPRYTLAVFCGVVGYAAMAFLMSATPLAMGHRHFDFGDTAIVIQWHVLAMFAPSFFTGHLIERFGTLQVMFSGCVLLFATVAVNLLGEGFWHFWVALFLLGISWNFLFVGATTLLTQCYRESEKNQAQALNDFLVFTCVSAATLAAGGLLRTIGWSGMNLAVLPVALLCALALTTQILVQRREDTLYAGVE